MSDYIEYLQCLKCGQGLEESKKIFVCRKCKSTYEVFDSQIVDMMPEVTPDIKLSVKKWNEFYEKQLVSGSYKREYELYKKNHLNDVICQIEKEFNYKSKVYLEIGCGPFFLGQNLASDCSFVIGVDFCSSALKIAKKMMDEKGIKNYLLIQGDVTNLPIKSSFVDLVYGGGVIEHFEDTQKCVNELYRVLRSDGVSFNTVPYLNVGSLTYRQVWGNIPNVPVLKQLAELVHIKILKEKHMIFGYEMSFLGGTLKKIHKKAGFKKTAVKNFEVKMSFDFIPKSLKTPFVWLAKSSRLFWPMVKVIAKK